MDKKEIWYDATNISEEAIDNCLPLVFNLGYDAIMVDEKLYTEIEKFPTNVEAILRVNENNKNDVLKIVENNLGRKFTVLFDEDYSELNDLFASCRSGIYIKLNDKESMDRSIELSEKYSPIVIEFESETNIPLELILAYSQKNDSVICKKIGNYEDGWIATMTMEMGSHAVLLSSQDINEISKLRSKLDNLNNDNIDIVEMKVLEIKHIGMGDRVCIDTVSKLDNDEGMIIGSTSNGGILVSSETHFLPYMDLRPFRVNAGAIHSYVVCPDNKTKYLSELKGGDEVLVTNSKGRTRAVAVGRIKMEKRPLLMIRAMLNDEEVNVIVQDDWHIRILGENGQPRNSVLLKKDDIVLGYIMKPGRHLGVEIDETIIEK